jgi:hypothetical protein
MLFEYGNTWLYNWFERQVYTELPEYTDKEHNIKYFPCQMIYMTLLWNLCKKYNLPSIIPDKKYNYINCPQDMCIKWYVNMYNMRQVDVPKYYKYKVNKFMKNKNQRFMAFPLIMYNPCSIYNNQNIIVKGHMDTFSHMTIIIYDKKYRYLERFDSTNNLDIYDGIMVDPIITNVFQNMFDIKINGINTPWMISDYNGIQTMQEMEIYKSYYKPILGDNIGFCTMYTLWYLEQRVKNPNNVPCNIVKTEIIRTLTLEKKNYPLTRMIKRYTYDKLTEYYSIYNNTYYNDNENNHNNIKHNINDLSNLIKVLNKKDKEKQGW